MWNPFLNYREGKLRYITQLSFAGYKLNNGSMSGLTRLQEYAVIVMDNELVKWSNTNKAILTISRG